MYLCEFDAFCIWGCVLMDRNDMIIKSGINNIEYIRKYIIVDRGLYTISMLVIQPMWVIDE